MDKIICLDLDDTLIQTQECYYNTNNNLVTLLQKKKNLHREEILEKQSEIDISLISKKGFSPVRFPTSWVKTFKHFLNESYFCQEEIFNEAYKVFTNKIRLHNDAERFLNRIKESEFSVWIVTHGDLEIQNKRIKDINLDWVDKVIISRHKNIEMYEELKTDSHKPLVMIGNSVRHDIIPALEAGLEGIHIKRERVWQYDISNPNHSYRSFNSLDEIWNYITEEESLC
ncbi:HAD family hydrolase [Shouchella miscanthi]|uniref:HAD family hydrolase n=1 Tax=Shouchella miscanthi TaxID=2598861 RepID=A0ABU6NL05_9BACI|nr:HAD family hydrolase [Shouchella miscanthi]